MGHNSTEQQLDRTNSLASHVRVSLGYLWQGPFCCLSSWSLLASPLCQPLLKGTPRGQWSWRQPLAPHWSLCLLAPSGDHLWLGSLHGPFQCFSNPLPSCPCALPSGSDLQSQTSFTSSYRVSCLLAFPSFYSALETSSVCLFCLFCKLDSPRWTVPASRC